MTIQHTLESVPDELLLRRLVELLRRNRASEADLVAHVGEVDVRRLYAREGCSSMFVYCTERLHLSEAEAYLRIAAARASRAHPVLLDMLTEGRLHLTAVARLAPHLTVENRESLLARAVHRTKREIEELVAEVHPRPDAPAVMRKLPERWKTTLAKGGSPARESGDAVAGSRLSLGRPRPELRPDGVAPPGLDLRLDAVETTCESPRSGSAGESEPRPVGVATIRLEVHPCRVEPPARVEPLAPGRYKVQFTASAALRDKLERLRALMRSSVPDGDLAAIIEEAVTEKLERLESRRFGRRKVRRCSIASPKAPTAKDDKGAAVWATASARPRGDAREVTPLLSQGPTNASSSSRHIPATVRRAVYERDGGRCRYVDEQGQRCTAREGLEFHHRHPFALGGDHSPANVSLQCRAHNGLLAEIDFGRDVAARKRRSRSQPPGLRLRSATSFTAAVERTTASGG